MVDQTNGRKSSRSADVHNIPIYDENQTQMLGYSVNTTPMDEEMIEGVERNGKISAVRRFFCLFVVFDLSFTALLWLICLVIGTTAFKQEMISQITEFSIENSLFDVVLTSLCRTITTTVSSIFLIVKIFYFEWQNSFYNNNYYVFTVILILCSFIISWGETWFLDFRVLPQEERARDILAKYAERRSRSVRNRSSIYYGSIDGTETQTFYSPIHSQDVSEDEDETLSNEARLQHNLQCDAYRKTATETLQAAIVIFKSEDWKLEKTTPSGDKSIVPITPRSLLNELFYKVEDVNKWNPNINYSKIIHFIDDHTDITYQVVNELGNGVISSRDFVNLRHWELRGDTYIIGLSATEHPSMPPVKNCVRGENGTSGCFLSPYGEDTLYEMLVQVDIKGWLPQSLVDQTMTTVMIEYAHHLQKHVATRTQVWVNSFRPSLSLSLTLDGVIYYKKMRSKHIDNLFHQSYPISNHEMGYGQNK
uniref:START domain-containing protein n=1 Tax=Strigamia maritima TaxID=126957 RepID=T1J4G5_STRMM